MISILVTARLTIHEASRRRLLWVGLVVSALYFCTYALGFYEVASQTAKQPDSAMGASVLSNFLTLIGLYVVNFLIVMMTVLTSIDAVSGEIASGTIHTLLARPVPRHAILLGKWLGLATMLTSYLALMAGGTIAVAYYSIDYLPPNVLDGLALMWLNCLVLVTLSLLGGTLFSTLANGVLVFGLFGIAFIGGWIEQIGAIVPSRTAVNIGIIASLLMPSEALWRRAAYEMRSVLTDVVGLTPFGSTSVPSPAMIVYAIVYGTAALGLALYAFSRRDL